MKSHELREALFPREVSRQKMHPLSLSILRTSGAADVMPETNKESGALFTPTEEIG